MKVIKTTALALMALLISATVVAGHHEKGEGPKLAAKPGQIMIVYYWPCADADTGLTLIKEMIAYERDASPHPYSAAPAIHSDGACILQPGRWRKPSPGRRPTQRGRRNSPRWKLLVAQQTIFQSMS